MKGKSKYILPLILAGVTAPAGIVANVNQVHQTTAYAETEDITNIAGAEMTLKKGFNDYYTLGTDSQITMPTVTIASGNGETIRYVIKRGDSVVYDHTGTSGTAPTEKFEPKFTGAYDVTITAEHDGVVVSEISGMTIMVQKPDAVINLPVNSRYVIPAKIPTNQGKDNENKLKIPAPTVMIEKEATDEEEETTEEKKASELGDNFTVSLVTPEKTEKLTLVTDSSEAHEDYYEVNPDLLGTAGTYQIRYEYKSGNTVISKLESNFQVVDREDFDLDDIELTMKWSGTVPSTGNVGTDISIPTITVVENRNSTDQINAHVVITVSRLDSQGHPITGETKEVEYKYDSSSKKYTAFFHPEVEGNYVLNYKADLELFGKESDTHTPAVIIKVQDKLAPSIVRPTYSYTYDEETGRITDYYTGMQPISESTESKVHIDEEQDDKLADILVSRAADVPSVVVKDKKSGVATFRLPAIWAEDNKDGYSDLKLTRYIRGNNISRKIVTADPNDVSEEITLSASGTYEVVYTATDKNGDGETATARFSLIVKDAEEDKEELANGETTINLALGVNNVTDKDIIKFNAPRVEDDFDSTLDTEVGYYLLKQDSLTDFDSLSTALVDGENTNDMHLLSLKDNKYEIDVKKVIKGKEENVKAILVVVKATADSSLKGTRETFDEDTQTISYKLIKVTRTTGDEEAASLKIVKDKAEDHSTEITTLDASTWNAQLINVNKSLFTAPEGTDEETAKGFPYNVTQIDNNGYAKDKDGNEIKVESTGAKLAPFDQSQERPLYLPAMVFEDSDANLKVRLNIKDRFGNNVSKYTYETIDKKSVEGNKYQYTVDNASFILSQSGIYTITYRAEDSNGNITARTMGIRVNDRTAPTIVVEDEDRYGVEVEVGKFFEVPYGILYKDDKAKNDRDVYWNVEASSGAEYYLSSTGFTPLTEGTFYVHYYGTDELENLSYLQDNSKFFVRAVDTTDPVFNEDSSYSLSPNMAWNPDNAEDEAESMKVLIPMVMATDPVRNVSVKVNTTITSPDGSNIVVREITEELNKEDNETDKNIYAHKDDCYYFVAPKQGVYTIKYEATDSASHTISKTVEVSIGDCIAPTITWADGATFADTKTITMQKDDEFELDLSKITIKDNVTVGNYLADNMTIRLTKPDGSDVTNLGTDKLSYRWKLSDTGAYTLSITVKDEAGQSNTYKYTINVPSETPETSTISPVIGTVLVVLAVVVLAGVVIYFVVSSRKKDGKSKAKKKN